MLTRHILQADVFQLYTDAYTHKVGMMMKAV